MKRLLPYFFAVVITLSLANPSLRAAGSVRENQRLQAGKITKNEAEHLVLRQFPGAKVNKCMLVPGKGHGIWMLEVVKAGAHQTSKVQVDGVNGKILP